MGLFKGIQYNLRGLGLGFKNSQATIAGADTICHGDNHHDRFGQPYSCLSSRNTEYHLEHAGKQLAGVVVASALVAAFGCPGRIFSGLIIPGFADFIQCGYHGPDVPHHRKGGIR